jgi:beta-glucosidase
VVKVKERFPKDFVWGVATASYQIEGAVFADGRGESIWDRFCRMPGRVAGGDRGDIACDHYHRYQEDVALMAELGVDSYRFSIAWPRVFPAGKGKPNPKGLDFYKRLLDELDKVGIKPMATLYHWDLPQALQEEYGGWVSRDVALYFQDYAAYVLEEIGERLPWVVTINEPWVAAMLGYGYGTHAPGIRDFKAALTAGHHLLYGHGLAVQAFRELGIAGQIGITLNLTPYYPYSDEEKDVCIARRMDGMTNRWYLDPVLKGEYPADVAEWFEERQILPDLPMEDLAIIAEPIDFLGINYYTRGIVGHSDEDPCCVKEYPPEFPVTDMGWEIYPQGLYDLLTRLTKDYGPIPMYITENGAAFPDQAEEGRVHDTARVEYLEAHFHQAAEAVASGVPLRGYYVWSFLDNFEWAFGYSKRFGIVFVDYQSQARAIKDSGLWYRDFLRKK